MQLPVHLLNLDALVSQAAGAGVISIWSHILWHMYTNAPTGQETHLARNLQNYCTLILNQFGFCFRLLIFSETISDCYLVPVSYTYDSVAEGVFLDELMGIPKKRESVFRVLCGVVKSLGKSRRCGSVRMHFGSPILLTVLSTHLLILQRMILDIIITGLHEKLVPWQTGHREKPDDRSLIRAIGYHVVHEAQSIISISLVSVVCSLLLCKFRQGVSINVLSADCQWLCDLIVADGSDVVGWHGGETSGRDAIEVFYALPHIHDSIERVIDEDADNYNICPVTSHRQLLNLAFNKNALVPLFALRSAIVGGVSGGGGEDGDGFYCVLHLQLAACKARWLPGFAELQWSLETIFCS
ncbi:unnamed protein product [Haemonchus placei]|uniref:GPAT_C domain-containing protein n=1 Tax=Haemonchus placei TaxID=6290 RepID=A0A0N4W1M8_HAEPC|nr:unnamed protein product [Haemonchus placei]